MPGQEDHGPLRTDSYTAEQIIDRLPASYFEKRDRKAETDKLRNTMSTFARGDFSFPPAQSSRTTATPSLAPLRDWLKSEFKRNKLHAAAQ